MNSIRFLSIAMGLSAGLIAWVLMEYLWDTIKGTQPDEYEKSRIREAGRRAGLPWTEDVS